VTSDWTVLALLLAGVATTCAVTSGAMLVRFRRSAAARQHDLERQLDALRDMVQILETRVPEEFAAEAIEIAPQISKGLTGGGGNVANADEEDLLAPEMQAVIAAAAMVCAGRKARVRSVRLVLPAHASAWSQQGRMLVQTSHNVRSRS
jgi:hypothetical protein